MGLYGHRWHLVAVAVGGGCSDRAARHRWERVGHLATQVEWLLQVKTARVLPFPGCVAHFHLPLAPWPNALMMATPSFMLNSCPTPSVTDFHLASSTMVIVHDLFLLTLIVVANTCKIHVLVTSKYNRKFTYSSRYLVSLLFTKIRYC